MTTISRNMALQSVESANQLSAEFARQLTVYLQEIDSASKAAGLAADPKFQPESIVPDKAIYPNVSPSTFCATVDACGRLASTGGPAAMIAANPAPPPSGLRPNGGSLDPVASTLTRLDSLGARLILGVLESCFAFIASLNSLGVRAPNESAAPPTGTAQPGAESAPPPAGAAKLPQTPLKSAAPSTIAEPSTGTAQLSPKLASPPNLPISPPITNTSQLPQTPPTTAVPSTGTAQLLQKQAWGGVSKEMWREIDAQRKVFGDSMDAETMINSIPNTGTVLYPADADSINSALRNSNVVVLKGGTYNIKEAIVLNGKTLVGAEGETVIINGSQVRSLTPNDGQGAAIKMGNNSTLKNINLVDADNQGIVAGDNNIIYQVSVERTGRNPDGRSTNGRGISSGSNNLLVSVAVSDSYNYRTWDGKTSDGTNTAGGGNGDGILSGSNVHIDVHSRNNSDDGFDTWEGSRNFFYFCSSSENGKSKLGMPNGQAGDGNAYKLGRGDGLNAIYKSLALNNPANGFDQNRNTRSPIIIASKSEGNGGANYAQGAFLSNNSPALDLGAPIGGLRR